MTDCWFFYPCICFLVFSLVFSPCALSFPPYSESWVFSLLLSDLEWSFRELVKFKSKCRMNSELLNTCYVCVFVRTACAMRRHRSFPALSLSAPGVSVCCHRDAWVMSACSVLPFGSNAAHNDRVLFSSCADFLQTLLHKMTPVSPVIKKKTFENSELS